VCNRGETQFLWWCEFGGIVAPFCVPSRFTTPNYSERIGEDAKDRCLTGLCLHFRPFFETEELDMTVEKWVDAFEEATTSGSLIFATETGCQMRILGADLSLTSPVDLFMAFEWIKDTHLRPQIQAHAWLGAVEVFGPLYHYRDDLCAEVVAAMHQEEEQSMGDLDNEPDSEAMISVIDLVDETPDTIPAKRYAKQKRSKEQDDEASAAMAPAGAATVCIKSYH
jgi:hypothetical protein